MSKTTTPKTSQELLLETMREIDEYNRKNNCYLSYGDYMAMKAKKSSKKKQ